MSGRTKAATVVKPKLVTLHEAARTCAVKPALFHSWVQRGVIVPVVRGRQGRGRNHLFSGRQVEALKKAISLWRPTVGSYPTLNRIRTLIQEYGQ